MAWHLAHEFTNAGIKINRIINRSSVTGRKLAQEIGSEFSNNLEIAADNSQLILMALSDSCLNQVIEKINPGNSILVHTSGSIDMSVFKDRATNYGVFYPFQTLSQNIKTDFSKIPVCIEASDEKTYTSISNLASKLSKSVYKIDSEQRRKLHLAGIMANNFTNHLLTLTFDYLNKNGIDKNLIFPLLKELTDEFPSPNRRSISF